MKVGDRIRVFECTGADVFGAGIYIHKGKQSAECGYFVGSNFGVDLPLKTNTEKTTHFGIDERGEAKHVATMVITKLK